MNELEKIKAGIRSLCDAGTVIHVSINMTRPKVIVTNAPAKIIGAYPNMFRLEECAEPIRCHSLKYTDVLIKQVEIRELEY